MCVRVAVMRIERGPVDNSWASSRETSYSLKTAGQSIELKMYRKQDRAESGCVALMRR